MYCTKSIGWRENMKIKAVLFDLGDTIMDEESEIKDNTSTTLKADLVHNMDKALRRLKTRGYLLALVADTKTGTYRNVLRQHGLYDLFDAFAISDEIGLEKPNPQIFIKALNALKIPPKDFGRVIMVGNNLKRDIHGANKLGLISIWLHWNDRYPVIPSDSFEKPSFIVHSADELLKCIESLEKSWIESEKDST
jgi:FMN phosphatase YigB (HAD superfamily)